MTKDSFSITVISILCLLHNIPRITWLAQQKDGLQKNHASVSKPIKFICISIWKSEETKVYKWVDLSVV